MAGKKVLGEGSGKTPLRIASESVGRGKDVKVARKKRYGRRTGGMSVGEMDVARNCILSNELRAQEGRDSCGPGCRDVLVFEANPPVYSRGAKFTGGKMRARWSAVRSSGDVR